MRMFLRLVCNSDNGVYYPYTWGHHNPNIGIYILWDSQTTYINGYNIKIPSPFMGFWVLTLNFFY